MKLAALAVLTTFCLGTAAHADPATRGQLKHALLERFDRNRDGKLDDEERHRAARALRRIADRLETKERHKTHRPAGAGAAAAPSPSAAPAER